MSDWKDKERAKFAGVEFPWNSFDIRGGMRFVHHKAPHVDGSIAELLGRETYEIRFSIPADNNTLQYPDFLDVEWPKLRTAFEVQTLDKLTVPGVGEIDAWACKWDQRSQAARQSGAEVEVTFYEDTNNLFLAADAIGREAGSFPTVVSDFQVQKAAYEVAPRSVTMPPSRYQRVRSNLNSLESSALALVAYRDQYELYARSQLTQVSRVLDLAHALTEDLQYELYTHQALRDAISELWATTRRFRDTVVTSDPIPHITMRTGTVSDVAREVYGKHLNVIEILHLNVIPRPLQIPIGTRLLVPRPPGASFRRRSLGTSV